jgi:DNA-binding response OmpR family regulator
MECLDKRDSAVLPLNLLLVGPREEDYFLIRDVLNRSKQTLVGNLDHAHSLAEIETRLESATYDLVLFQYESSDQLMAAALRRLRQQGRTMPFLILAEGTPETELIDWVGAGACEFVDRDELGRESFLRTIRSAANLHRREEHFKNTEQMLRKLHSAVEQSVDMVMITDVVGRIEYVNPAFEKTTGYNRDEVLGLTPRILAFVPPGRYVLLQVTDSGCGIPPEQLPHIFEPFYTTKEQGKGTGLGLATLYGIVKQSGGFVWVNSEPTVGTTFKIYFPEVRCKEVVTSPGASEVDSSPVHGSETILVVEDEEAVREPSCEFLRQGGYTVLEATNGKDALALVDTHTGLFTS